MKVCRICGLKHHGLGLCRKHYDQQRHHSQKKICPGCDDKRITNLAVLCSACAAKARLCTLTKKVKIGSGGEVRAIWDDKTKGFKISPYELDRLETEKVRGDLISQHYTKIIRRGYE